MTHSRAQGMQLLASRQADESYFLWETGRSCCTHVLWLCYDMRLVYTAL